MPPASPTTRGRVRLVSAAVHALSIPWCVPFGAASITSDVFGVRTADVRFHGPFADVSQPFEARNIDPRGAH